MKYNILILSAGRRVELITQFRKAAQRLGIESDIITADCSQLAPALYFSDKKEILPRVEDSNYIVSLINLIIKHDVKLVIPTIDTELMILSLNKKLIESKTNAIVMISNVELIEICRDKYKTSDFLYKLGFNVPRIHEISEINNNDNIFPLFIKPKSGSSSINAFKVENYDELLVYSKLIKDYLIQDYISGDEYTVDAFLDFDSNLVTIVPRLRIATRSGEISKGKIVKDKEIIDTIKDLLKKTQFIGHITIQLKKNEKGIEFIEINPRFGGGAPMSIEAGANSCESLYKLLIGEKLTYNENYRNNLIFLRYDSSVMIDPSELNND